MIRYHFTAAANWPSIVRDGIFPYELNPEHQSTFKEVGLETKIGIYIWPEVDDELLFDFFLFKRIKTGLNEGLLLQCDIDPDQLILHNSDGYEVGLCHLLSFRIGLADSQRQHRVPLEICRSRIPPDRVKLVKRVGFIITTVELAVGMDMVIV